MHGIRRQGLGLCIATSASRDITVHWVCESKLWTHILMARSEAPTPVNPTVQRQGSFFPTLRSLRSLKPFLQCFCKGSFLVPAAVNWYFGEPVSLTAHPGYCPSRPADAVQQGAGTATILWLHRGVCYSHLQQLWQPRCSYY